MTATPAAELNQREDFSISSPTFLPLCFQICLDGLCYLRLLVEADNHSDNIQYILLEPWGRKVPVGAMGVCRGVCWRLLGFEVFVKVRANFKRQPMPNNTNVESVCRTYWW